MTLKKRIARRTFCLELLEDRRCLTSSVGWDGPGQGHADLKYYIGEVPSNINRTMVESAVTQALAVWSSVADITFTTTTAANQDRAIDITFTNIDGAGGTLAQAYLPSDLNHSRLAGDIQFDAAESWEIGNAQGTAAFDLLWVAVHEIGHALGLEHADHNGPVMAASVSAAQSFTALDSADVDAILALYAAADATMTAPLETPATTDPTTSPTPTIPTLDNPTTPSIPTIPTPTKPAEPPELTLPRMRFSPFTVTPWQNGNFTHPFENWSRTFGRTNTTTFGTSMLNYGNGVTITTVFTMHDAFFMYRPMRWR